jgi:hypothetical protein
VPGTDGYSKDKLLVAIFIDNDRYNTGKVCMLKAYDLKYCIFNFRENKYFTFFPLSLISLFTIKLLFIIYDNEK